MMFVRQGIGKSVAMIFIIALFLVHCYHLRVLTDDAYISFRYAENFSRGDGLVWNLKEPPVEGYTNFLWVVLLAAVIRAGLPVAPAAQILGVLFGIATLLLVLRTQLREENEGKPNVSAALLLSLSGSFASWATSGMETVFFAFLIFSGFVQYLKEQRGERFPYSSILFLMAALARPEALLVFAVLRAHSLYLQYRKGGIRIRRHVPAVTLFAVPFLVYFVWRYRYYGFLLPNTFYMKVGSSYWQVYRGFKYAAGFLGVTVLPLLVFLRPFLGRLSDGERSALWVIGSYTAYIVLVGGDYMAQFRFFVPLIPLMVLVISDVLAGLLTLRMGTPALRGIGVALLVILFLSPSFPLERLSRVLPLPQIYWNIRYDGYPRLMFERWQVNRLEAIGRWVRDNLNPEETFACQGIGAIGYLSGRTVYDINGLTDAVIAHKAVAAMGKGIAGHEKEDLLYVLSREPDYVLVSRYLKKDDRFRSFEELYEGKLVPYTEQERESILEQMKRHYEVRYVPFEDSSNAETGYLVLLRRKS